MERDEGSHVHKSFGKDCQLAFKKHIYTEIYLTDISNSAVG